MMRTLALLVLMTGCRCSPGPAEPPVQVAPAPDEIVTTVMIVDSVKECQECALQLRAAIRQLEGIEQFDVAMMVGQATIRHRASITAEQLVTTAAEAGFEAELVTD